MSQSQRRKPQSFSLEDAPEKPKASTKTKAKPAARKPVVIETPPPPPPTAVPVPPAPKRRGMPFLKILLAGLGGLISIAITTWVWTLVEEMFARADWLGYTAAALAALVVLGILGFILREIAAFFRLGKINKLRDDAAHAIEANDPRKAQAVSRALIALYEDRLDMARARASAGDHLGEVIDGADLLKLVERDLMGQADAQARGLISASAKRVSMITAISPRAIVDLAFVLFEIVRLSRRIAETYGGRPSGFAFLSLLKRIGMHLTVTGGIAMSDAIVQQLVGQGLAARLSARLGEGLFNGMMTTRVGLAAIEVCRPMPFHGLKPPGFSEMAKELMASGKKDEAEKDKAE